MEIDEGPFDSFSHVLFLFQFEHVLEKEEGRDDDGDNAKDDEDGSSKNDTCKKIGFLQFK